MKHVKMNRGSSEVVARGRRGMSAQVCEISARVVKVERGVPPTLTLRSLDSMSKGFSIVFKPLDSSHPLKAFWSTDARLRFSPASRMGSTDRAYGLRTCPSFAASSGGRANSGDP